MPLRDGTGPMGMGSMTGKQAGYCTGYGAQGGHYVGAGFGRGRGRRCNNRYPERSNPGRRPYFGNTIARFAAPSAKNNFRAPLTREEEKQSLQKEADALQSHLNEVINRLNELENQKI